MSGTKPKNEIELINIFDRDGKDSHGRVHRKLFSNEHISVNVVYDPQQEKIWCEVLGKQPVPEGGFVYRDNVQTYSIYGTKIPGHQIRLKKEFTSGNTITSFEGFGFPAEKGTTLSIQKFYNIHRAGKLDLNEDGEKSIKINKDFFDSVRSIER